MALAISNDVTIDFSRYAPQQHIESDEPSGEIEALWKVFKGGCCLIGESTYHIGRIILQRSWHWIVTNIVQSLKSAWLIGSAGWIASATLFALHMMAR